MKTYLVTTTWDTPSTKEVEVKARNQAEAIRKAFAGDCVEVSDDTWWECSTDETIDKVVEVQAGGREVTLYEKLDSESSEDFFAKAGAPELLRMLRNLVAECDDCEARDIAAEAIASIDAEVRKITK